MTLMSSLFALHSLAAAVSNPDVPPIPREFRAAWVATVDNIDWPSKRTLSTAEQKAELIRIMDEAAAIHLNAIILQVRPSADALYPSKLEPWSEYLTGLQGRAPSPNYDPLALAVQEAHKRGLELHCWFNPYRAKHFVQKGPLASSHIGVTHPEVVKSYGRYLWMDPGEPLVQQHSLNVIQDVVKRYDIDGVHIDDYFYPYPEGTVPFPDEPSYAKYRENGGKLALDDWRRDNVNKFIHNMYSVVKKTKKWVKVGISPFGIYRPHFPATIKTTFDQYGVLYADARKWLNEGWCDYYTPQLYWSSKTPDQNYGDLLDWWIGENKQGRHMWPGNYTSRTGPEEAKSFTGEEIGDQIDITREKTGATGNVHFSMKAFLANWKGVRNIVARKYTEPAFVPASPWLAQGPIGQPKPVSNKVTSREPNAIWKVKWSPVNGIAHYLVNQSVSVGGVEQWATWHTWPTNSLELPKMAGTPQNPRAMLSKIAVVAMDRCGNASAPIVFDINKATKN